MQINPVPFQLDTIDFHSIAFNKDQQTFSVNDQMVNF